MMNTDKIRIAIINHLAPILLMLLTVLSISATVAVVYGKMEIAIVLIILWLTVFVRLCRAYRESPKKLQFMLNALGNGDYSFKFRTDGMPTNDMEINESLNRIAEIITNARNETVEHEKFYELIINSVKTGILVVDDMGNIYLSNESAMRMIGMSVLTHTEQIKRISTELHRNIVMIAPGERRHVTLMDERGENQLSLQASKTRLKDREMRIIAVNDINSELNDNEIDSWTKLIRVLTHEIMNTITPVTSLSSTLLKKLPAEGKEDTHELRNGLEVINKTSNELIDFVENYRKFTHVPTPVPDIFYVKPFAERMRHIALAHPEKENNISIELDIRPNDLMVYADEKLISHVVTNILKNAIQAIGQKEEGKISITAYADSDEAVIISIANNGPQIPKDVAAHIFIPFFTTKKEGSGIGLSISKQIMRLSGGSLTLKTDAKHGLTIFELRFP